MADPKSMTPGQAKAVKGSLIGGAALAAALGLIQNWEGTKLNPYRDIVGVWTVCTGETRVEMRRYTRAECDGMLREAIESDYGKGVLRAVPALQSRPYQLAASISLAYNIGVPAFTRSTVARRFNQGNWRGGCEAFLAWRFAGGREVKGLLNRRQDERRVCLTGL
jgi:lysozyme